METEVRQTYAVALSQLMEAGKSRVPAVKRRQYEAVQRRALRVEATAARQKLDQQRYLALVDREYKAARRYWR